MSSEHVMKTPPYFISLANGEVIINFKSRIERLLPSHSMGKGQKSFPTQLQFGSRLLKPPAIEIEKSY